MNFAFKKELPSTIEELNKYEHRIEQDEDAVYDTVVSILYGIIAVMMFCMFCGYMIDHLNTFENQIQNSFQVR